MRRARRLAFSSPRMGFEKAAAARLVDMGLTEAELEQIMGWAPGSGMAGIYTRKARRRGSGGASCRQDEGGTENDYRPTFAEGWARRVETSTKSICYLVYWCGQEDSNLHSG